jgi:ketosteroid isomerase-like protein
VTISCEWPDQFDTEEKRMEALSNREIVAGLYRALAEGNPQGVFELFAEDIVVHEADCLPYGGVHKGRDAVVGMAMKMLETFDPSAIRCEEIIGDGDRIVGLARGVWRSRSGRSIEVDLAEVFTIRDGKVTEVRPFIWDTAALVGSGVFEG